MITSLNLGGAETQLVSLATEMKKKGHEIRVFSIVPPTTTILVDKLMNEGIPFSNLGLRRFADLARALFIFRSNLFGFRPDLVHSHMVHANLFTRLIKFTVPRLKLINTAHSIYEGGKFRDLCYRATNFLSDLNTTVSEAATNRYIRDKLFKPKNTITVLNGIDIDRFSPPLERTKSKTAFTWLAVGRLDEVKDYPTLFSALGLLKNSELRIAGTGKLKNELHQMVQNFGLEERVTFLGAIEDPAPYYKSADGFVLSSRYEGYGLVVGEAMSTQLPVVVTDCGGPTEIVGYSGQFGFCVPVSDHIALSNAMYSIETMSFTERNKMGKFARERIIQNYSLSATVKLWDLIYSSIN